MYRRRRPRAWPRLAIALTLTAVIVALSIALVEVTLLR